MQKQKMYEVGDTTEMQSIVVARKLARPRRDNGEHIVLHMQTQQIGHHDHVQYIVHRAEVNPDGKRILWSGGYHETFEDAVADYADRR